MTGQIGRLSETPPTYFAQIWFLPCVDPHVDVPFTLGGKTFSTHDAAVRLLSIVSFDMVFQVA